MMISRKDAKVAKSAWAEFGTHPVAGFAILARGLDLVSRKDAKVAKEDSPNGII